MARHPAGSLPRVHCATAPVRLCSGAREAERTRRRALWQPLVARLATGRKCWRK
jgi:hypothetical protein